VFDLDISAGSSSKSDNIISVSVCGFLTLCNLVLTADF
jgi:hypothetical protein